MMNYGRYLLICTAFVSVVSPASSRNMNGEYLVSESTNLDPSRQTFNTDYASKGHEYFDVYSPIINSTYGMVYWTQMEDVILPAHIVKRFANKTIAITGYEMDQVLNPQTDNEISVPINAAYNHHYVFWLQGVNSEMTLTQARTNEHSYWMRGDGLKHMSRSIKDDPNKSSNIPTSQIFAEGNGGESRKSFHGYPNGVAQLIESPYKFVINPMQIDTWNRDRKMDQPFKAGPLPPQAESPPDADYSGLLECPCTDRLSKKIDLTYSTRTAGVCGSQRRIYNSSKCFDGIEKLSGKIPKTQKVVNDKNNYPDGCSYDVNGNAIFNEAIESAAVCGNEKIVIANGATFNKLTGVKVNVTLDGPKNEAFIEISGPADVWFGVGINANAMADLPYAIIVSGTDAGSVSVSERKLGAHAPGKELSSSITIISNAVVGNVRTVQISRPLAGKTTEYYSFNLNQENTIPLIVAIGTSSAFGYHKTHDSTMISLFNRNKGSTTCVCNAGTKGEICGNVVGGCIPFAETGGQDLKGKRCPPQPLSDLAAQSNPTCTIQQYSGGLRCCHHRNILLQKSQNAWPDNILSYKMKFRFWFQDYVPATSAQKASHENLVRFYWQTESFAGEYDVPKGSLNMPGTMKNPKTGGYEYKITSHWKVEDMVWGCDPRTSTDHCTGNSSTGIQLRYAGGHCHAPSCKHIELSTNVTGEWKVLCKQLPHIGTGDVQNDKFDEKGYIALPPCLWGSKDEGLAAPVTLPFGSWLRSEKINNSTNGHYGEMASWQMRGVMV